MHISIDEVGLSVTSPATHKPNALRAFHYYPCLQQQMHARRQAGLTQKNATKAQRHEGFHCNNFLVFQLEIGN
jgi:hypothetical protein